MKRTATTLLALLVASVASVALTSQADAALRVPQVPVSGVALQNYFNSIGESINVQTDQDATQTWSHTSSGTTTHSLLLETSNVGNNTFGQYNGSDVAPGVYPIIAGGSVTFGGVQNNNFGYALTTPGGFFWSQDARNVGGLPRALVYRGTGANAGTWFICFEDGTDNDFDDTIVLMESVNTTAVSRTSWGTLKARFR